jgi:metal-dependent amidase/aminoacylase/carboxypeptidase family protein
MTDLVSLRHKLHSIAELSGSEFQTSNLIFEFLETLNPHILQKDVGGQGVIAVFDSGKPGHTIMFRSIWMHFLS